MKGPPRPQMTQTGAPLLPASQALWLDSEHDSGKVGFTGRCGEE